MIEMRILYVIALSGCLATLLLWLGAMRIVSRKLAGALAFCSLALGGGLLALAVFPGNSFYGPVIAQVKTQEKVIALTFDDGPGQYTDELLAVLDKYGVKVIGVQVDAIERGEDRIEFKNTMNSLKNSMETRLKQSARN